MDKTVRALSAEGDGCPFRRGVFAGDALEEAQDHGPAGCESYARNGKVQG